MEPYYEYLNNLAALNHKEYGNISGINWCNAGIGRKLQGERDKIISALGEQANWSFKGTKPWINSLSPGCQLCGTGEWSCLFISGLCNANCFYCPAPQVSDDPPSAQQIEFTDPEQYAEFINFFGYKGVSFSGGEPFLKYPRIIEFLQVLRKRCSPDLFIWIYTNGLLVTREKLKGLANLGLNEIRFDIGATRYNLRHVAMATGIIPNITVEIPSVPVNASLLKSLIPEMIDTGVTNLNLHRLRLTKHNASNLVRQKYTINHGEQPTVAESENSALGVIDFVIKSGSSIGVNYCSFQFKNRYQKAGYQRKMSTAFIGASESSETGFALGLWSYQGTGEINEKVSEKEMEQLISNGVVTRLSMNSLINNDIQTELLIVDIMGAELSMNRSPGSKVVRIGESDYYMETGRAIAPMVLQGIMLEGFIYMCRNPSEIPTEKKLFELWQLMFIEPGLREFY